MGYTLGVEVGIEGATVIGGALVEESPVVGGALVATLVLWVVTVLGLEMASSVYLSLVGAMVMGCCSIGLALARAMVLGYYLVGLACVGAIMLDLGRGFSVELAGVKVEVLAEGWLTRRALIAIG